MSPTPRATTRANPRDTSPSTRRGRAPRPNRGDTLRRVIAVADQRCDGRLPRDVPGVAETFEDQLSLVGALQLRWHTRLSGRIERELMAQPLDLEDAVVAAWRGAAAEMPGVRAILDRQRSQPGDRATAAAMARATIKERTMLAVMAGRVSAEDAAALRIGEQIELRARAGLTPPAAPTRRHHRAGLLDRLKAVLPA
ncbi:hypothetical protein [Nocardioides ferulae]|uniref:hypothetical protein n=1 Tax=Nocardioides ferulae TaxID=2340821 RepID=UPI001F0BF071|nr:hypothetical protein [Nocardioides ferulae]